MGVKRFLCLLKPIDSVPVYVPVTFLFKCFDIKCLPTSLLTSSFTASVSRV